jgi:hypothetical protein
VRKRGCYRKERTMNTEAVLSRILAGVTEILKILVTQVGAQAAPPTLYDLEEQTHAALEQIGQVVVQEIVTGQGSGLMGPERACPCGGEQRYHDQERGLHIQTSLGIIRLLPRAYYHCTQCQANSYPLDEQLGLGQAGRMSRYLQEQCGWLLALLPARLAQQTLVRFGWPAVAASQVREHGEGLGAELEQCLQEDLATARQEAAQTSAQQSPPRQIPSGERLYAAPDGVMYCTTERDQETGSLRWRELKVAAIYEARPGEAGLEAEAVGLREPEDHRPILPVRTRVAHWLREQEPTRVVAAPDQALRVSYVAETGPWEQFGARLWAELWARGVGRPVRDLVVVADGADHIDQVVNNELRLPGIHLTRILDIAHAQQHVWAVSNAAFGEGSRAARDWVQTPLTALERGQLATVLDALESLALQRAQTAPMVAQTARKAAAYFTQRQEQVDYPGFVAVGKQIGSGLAESACKRFGTDRMKGAGMRWTVRGAQAVATLRMFVLSERWAEVTAYCRKAA